MELSGLSSGSQAARPHPSATARRSEQTVRVSSRSSLPQVKYPVVTWCCVTRLAGASLRTHLLLLLCPYSLLLKRMWQRAISVEWIFNTPSPWLIHVPRAYLPCSLPVTFPLAQEAWSHPGRVITLLSATEEVEEKTSRSSNPFRKWCRLAERW